MGEGQKTECSGLKYVSTKFICQNPNVNVTIFGDKDFKEVGLNEVIRVGPIGLLSL